MPRNFEKRELAGMELLRTPVWVLDETLGALWWANSAATQLRLDPRDQALLPCFIEATASRYRAVRGGELDVAGEALVVEPWTCVLPDAAATTLQVTASPILIEEGRPAILAEGRLLDERHDHSALRSAHCLHHLPLAVEQVRCLDGEVLEQNAHALHLFGQAGSFSMRFVDVDAGKKFLGQLGSVEARLRTDSSGTRWFSIDGRRTMDPITGDELILVSCADVHARRLAEAALQRAKQHAEATNQANADFRGVITHEMRTPLNSVIGHADLLKETPLDEQQQRYVNSLLSSGLQLQRIVNSSLDLFELELGKMRFECVEIDIDSVAQGALDAVEYEANSRGLCLHRATEIFHQNTLCADMTLLGNPQRLEDILLIYLKNAIKFTHHGSIKLAMYITARSERNVTIRFDVIDTGIGISPADQAKLFDRNGLETDVFDTKSVGGISMAKMVATRLGGAVGCNSELGRGSTFWVELPFRILPAGATHVPSKESREGDTVVAEAPLHIGDDHCWNGPLHVLVVDDTASNVRLLANALDKLGHSYRVAADGVLAIEHIQAERFDLVFMDKHMPNLDGMSATKRIRALGHTADNLPIIGLTADFKETDLQTYLDAGMNTCIGKPCRLRDIRAALDTVKQRACLSPSCL